MLNNTALQNDIETQNNTNTFYTNPTRATWTTVGLGVGAFIALVLTYYLWWALMGNASFDTRTAAYPILQLYSIIVPIAIAGAYWLALLRLRRVRALQSWLETVVLSLLYFVVIGTLMGVGNYYLRGYYLPPTLDNPWWVFTAFSEAPLMILYALILVLVVPTIALGFASMFARWHEARLVHLPSNGWLDFLVVLGIGSVALLLTGLAFAYIPEKFFLIFILPGAIMSILVSWWEYHTMFKAWQNMPVITETVAETKK